MRVTWVAVLIRPAMAESHTTNLGPNLKRLIAFGEKIEERFGKDWRWHYCTPGCKKWSGEAAPYKRCEECEEVRKTAEREAIEFFETVRL